MGFVDIIGVARGYVKKDFELTDFAAQFLPMMVLLWFFVLAVPVGVLQDKFGKRNMLNIGMVIQAIGLGLPFILYSLTIMYASFILLGIGNTIIQVSANPLLQDVSPSEKLASYMSTSQFVKAIISFSGPLIATFFFTSFGDWKLAFAVYGITSLLAALWLSMTPISESKPDRKPASLGVFLAPGNTTEFVSIFIIGLGIGNMFPIIFSLALDRLPERANEVSGLIVLAVSGGAFIPLMMGFISTIF